MAQIDKIKEMIREMMNQEMENYKEAVSNGEADETASPVVYTTLQVLMANSSRRRSCAARKCLSVPAKREAA